MKTTATEAQVLQIRQEWRSGNCDTRGWADALGCSLETVRRIGRGDTYRHVSGADAGHVPAGQARLASTEPDEPTEADIAASLARFRAALSNAPQTAGGVNSLLDEMQKKGEEQR